MSKPRFVIGIDVGGTFTDLLAYDEGEGRLLSAKVPSIPGAQWQGVLGALEALEIELASIRAFVHGTTIATNIKRISLGDQQTDRATELAGKLDGLAIRVPTINVSLVDLSFQSKRATTAMEVNQILKKASEEKALQGVLNYSEEALVSIDYNHNSASSTVDASQTRVIGDFVKVLAWYDNEWGFSNRMLDVTTALMKAA